jgi:peptide/nickel transport system permease protein
MLRFILPRLGLAVLLLLTVSAITFGAMNILGDPLFNILGPIARDTENPASVVLIDAAKEQYNLDRALPVRWALWLGDFVRGDFGVQFSEDGQPPVRNLIVERIPRTLSLLVLAQTFAVLIAIPWALATASKANTRFDKSSAYLAFLMLALPEFALAVVLKYVLAIRFSIFPQAFVANDPFLTRLWQLTLPALALAIPVAAVYQRLLRTDLITTLQEDFILTARSKGVSRRNILFKHALRPSLFTFVTIFAVNTGALIGGALIVEQVFLIPGLGRATVEAILREDFPVVLAIVVIISATFVFLTLLVDIIYGLIDPRVRT